MKIKIDEKEFIKFLKECKKNSISVRPMLDRSLNEIGARLLRRVKQKTPVGLNQEGKIARRDENNKLMRYKIGDKKGQIKTRIGVIHQGGNLRRSWYVTNLIKKEDRSLIMVYNTARYGMYVEYGHRQTPGRFVPVLGKRLKARWVKGRFMLTKSIEEVDKLTSVIIKKHIKEAVSAWK
ncbi:HK97 gp10 family phage protein, partial [Fusobacterium gastrosuis]|uniref:HK97 gp10 family phage protein n=1 Tax=Fusobacterium gastrosuis TaxID=1755100 RepID=UPI002A986D89|nr:HK97 gp10 family phage protein [Fusobacterium gastrosuis]MDY5795458.1 HK97 gp10 family phage protein [Fusobacterium gastrosuis]